MSDNQGTNFEHLQEKYEEAEFFLNKARFQRGKPFRFYISAYIAAIESIPRSIREEKAVENMNEWLEQDSEKELHDLIQHHRNLSLHQGKPPISCERTEMDGPAGTGGYYCAFSPGIQPRTIAAELKNLGIKSPTNPNALGAVTLDYSLSI